MEKLPREKQETLERGLSGIPRLFRNRSASCAAGGKADLVLLDRICEDTPDCMENSLKVHVSSLRRKMKEDTGKIIWKMRHYSCILTRLLKSAGVREGISEVVKSAIFLVII